MINEYTQNDLGKTKNIDEFVTFVSNKINNDSKFVNAFFNGFTSNELANEIREVAFDNYPYAVIEETIGLLQKRVCDITLEWAKIEVMNPHVETRRRLLSGLFDALPRMTIDDGILDQAKLTITILNAIKTTLSTEAPMLSGLIKASPLKIIEEKENNRDEEFLLFVYQEYLNSINLHHLGEELIYHSDFVTADYILKLKIIEMIESKMLSQLKRAVKTDNKYLEDYLQSLGLFRSLSTLSEDDIEELVNKGMEQILEIEKGSE